MQKLPPDAFSYYVALGPGRTLRAVASHFGVTPRSVAYLAKKEGWKDRAQEIEREACDQALEHARAKVLEAKVRDIDRCIEARERALRHLLEHPIESVMDAVHVLDVATRGERMILTGQITPGDRLRLSEGG